MISTGRASFPRKYETLRNLVANFTLDTLNGQLAVFIARGLQGQFSAWGLTEFAPGQWKLDAAAALSIGAGADAALLALQAASVEAVAAPKEGGWNILGGLVITGRDDISGKSYAFRMTGLGEQGDTSVPVEFGISDQPGLRGTSEVLSWAISGLSPGGENNTVMGGHIPAS